MCVCAVSVSVSVSVFVCVSVCVSVKVCAAFVWLCQVHVYVPCLFCANAHTHKSAHIHKRREGRGTHCAGSTATTWSMGSVGMGPSHE